jgi:uncharacterized membrane protein
MVVQLEQAAPVAAEVLALLVVIRLTRGFFSEREIIMNEDVELIVMAFQEEARAREVLKHLQKRQKEHSFKLYNAAVVIKDHEGKASLYEIGDVSGSRGEVLGGIAGGLIGLVGGPAGMLVGAAAGAATGGVTANRIDLGFSKQFLENLKSCLTPGTSAVIVLVEQRWIDALVQELNQYQGKLLRHQVKSEVVDQLQEAIKNNQEGEQQ